jgi:hypothetical protein
VSYPGDFTLVNNPSVDVTGGLPSAAFRDSGLPASSDKCDDQEVSFAPSNGRARMVTLGITLEIEMVTVRSNSTPLDCSTNWIAPAAKLTVLWLDGRPSATAFLVRWSISVPREITVAKVDEAEACSTAPIRPRQARRPMPQVFGGRSAAHVDLMDPGAPSLPRTLDPTSCGPL